MPRRSKGEKEEFLVTEFLSQQAVSFSKIERLSRRLPEHDMRGIHGPDIWATFEWEGIDLEVAFEVTDYYVDAGQDGSTAVRRKSIWAEIQNRLQLTFANEAALRSLDVDATFTSTLPKQSGIVAMAEQLGAFLISHIPQNGREAHYFRDSVASDSPSGHFEDYPLLKVHFQSLTLRATEFDFGWRSWHCSDASFVGFSAPKIAQIIEKKRSLFSNYVLDGVAECWLLICAGGDSSTNRIDLCRDLEKQLKHDGLAESVRTTPFTKVIVWDRVDRNYLDLVETVRSAET